MKFKVLTWNAVKGEREAQIIEADSARDAQEATATPTVHVMGVVSLSVLDRVAQRERERVQAKSARRYVSTRRLERKLERNRIRAANPDAGRIRFTRDGVEVTAK